MSMSLMALAAMMQASPSFSESCRRMARREEQIIGLAHLCEVSSATVIAEADARGITIEELYHAVTRGEFWIEERRIGK